MTELPQVTLLIIDCKNITRALKSLLLSMQYTKFADVLLLSSLPGNLPEGIRLIKIPAITSIQEYSKFMIRELYKYINTNFVLCTQWDGFIVNSEMYSDNFLKYDYIGAVWDWNDEKSVGNGGFSLRSKRFIEASSQLPIKNFHPEDVTLCRVYRNLLIEKGIRFAPKELAKRFSFEGNSLVGHKWTGNTWGFHDFQVSDMSNWSGYNKFMASASLDY